MELVSKKRLGLYAGRSSRPLAQEIARKLDEELGEVKLVEFASGETYCRFEDSIRDTDVFIISTHCEPVNDSIMEQLIMIDAAKRASARRIIAVCPYFGYARQDRKARPREPITAKLMADLMQAAGAERMISVDLHSGQIQGFFDTPVDHLTAMPVLEEYVLGELHNMDDVVIVAPDAGRVKVAERFAQHIGADLAFAHKKRNKEVANTVETSEIIGEVDGKHCVIIDDMIDTAGTVCGAADLVMDRGATDVWIMATHGVLSGPAVERLQSSKASRVVLTNSLPIPDDKLIDKIQILSIAGVISAAIESVFEGTSVSELFHGENLH
jgi:ribose-phosphate pyrophosphokinase